MTTGDGKYIVGFIGIGKMGFPMASRIAAHAYPLHVFAVSDAALTAFCSLVAASETARTPADISRTCEVVILMLPDSELVTRVLFGEDGGLPVHLSPGSVVIDMSSSDPSVMCEIGPQMKETGVDFIDAPVSGGAQMRPDTWLWRPFLGYLVYPAGCEFNSLFGGAIIRWRLTP